MREPPATNPGPRGPTREQSARMGCSPATHTAIFGPDPQPNTYHNWIITYHPNPPHGFLYTAQAANGNTLQAGHLTGLYRLIDKEIGK